MSASKSNLGTAISIFRNVLSAPFAPPESTKSMASPLFSRSAVVTPSSGSSSHMLPASSKGRLTAAKCSL